MRTNRFSSFPSLRQLLSPPNIPSIAFVPLRTCPSPPSTTSSHRFSSSLSLSLLTPLHLPSLPVVGLNSNVTSSDLHLPPPTPPLPLFCWSLGSSVTFTTPPSPPPLHTSPTQPTSTLVDSALSPLDYSHPLSSTEPPRSSTDRLPCPTKSLTFVIPLPLARMLSSTSPSSSST